MLGELPGLWLRDVVRGRDPLRRKMFAERLGGVAPPAGSPGTRLLVDANGHGEYGQVHTLLRRFRERYTAWTVILVSWNPEIVELAERNPAIDQVVFMPYDTAVTARRFFRRLKPRAFVTVDQLRLPVVLRTARALGVRTMLLSACFPDIYMESVHMRKALAFGFHRDLDRICVSDDEAWRNFRRMGCDEARLRRTGYMKFDVDHLLTTEPERRALRAELGLRDTERLWVAGSVRPGEDEAVIAAYAQVRATAPDLRLLLAPRYVTDVEAALRVAGEHGLKAVRRTELAAGVAGESVIVLDTYGELARLYAIGDVVFVGNSLVPADAYALGQNLAEPLVHGRATVFGPHMNKWRVVTAALTEAWAGLEVGGVDALAASVTRLLADPALRARVEARIADVVAQNRDVVERNFAALVELLEAA